MLLAQLRQQLDAYRAHQALLKLAPDAVLVGGAVRDLLLGDVIHDLDYVLPGAALIAARRLGDAIGGAYYPMDGPRGIGRVVWRPTAETRLVIDVSTWRGSSLDEDLRARDFTINAIALLADGQVCDPLDGVEDLMARRLRPCSSVSLETDPLRILRAVRFLFQFRLQPHVGMEELVAAATPGLDAISPERQRDELAKILALPDPQDAVRQLQAWNLLRRFFPALVRLIGIEQSTPHVCDAYEHSLATLRWQARIDRLLRGVAAPTTELDQIIIDALASISPDLRAYLDQAFVPDRPRWLWLRFAALAHDWGKAATRSSAEDGRIRFLGHEAISAELSAGWLEQYRCASSEIEYVRRLCQGHMRPIHLSQRDRTPSRRALYRFYRDLGDAAPAALLLHIADHLATYGPEIVPNDFREHLLVVAAMLEPMTAAGEQNILPTPLLNGNDLIKLFDLQPGPRIGELLEALREAQAVGEVGSRGEAERWVGEIIKRKALT
ncbi:MAG TPA: HD domain-containing protein [Caldilineae bacterium]|nr:HD domain-containing protein [Caldilineae bacterium]